MFVMIIPLFFYEVTAAINLFSSLALGIALLLVSADKKPNRLFAYLCFSVFFWSICFVFWLRSHDEYLASYFLRTCMLGVVFMPSIFVHFVHEILYKAPPKNFILFNYILSLCFGLSIYSPLNSYRAESFMGFPYWLHAGPLFHLMVLHFCVVVIYSFVLLFNALKQSSGMKRQQILYVIIGTGIAFFSGAFDFCGWYRIPIPPVLNVFITGYVICIAYAIARYQLMNIKLAITSTGIFMAVYSLTLGVPFYLLWLGKATGAVIWACVLATFAPAIYSRLQRRAEAAILRVERDYHALLLSAADTLTNKKTVDEVTHSIVGIFSQSIQIKNAALYLTEENTFKLKDVFGESSGYVSEFASEALSSYWQEHGVAYLDELKLGPGSSALAAGDFLCFKPASVAVPFVRNGKLLGVLFLGEKKNLEPYSERDLSVFKIIADHSALAIENALYVESLERTQEKLLESEKMATIGFLVGGLAHQLKNRLTPMVFNADIAARYIRQFQEGRLSQEACVEAISCLEKINTGVESSKGVINGILNYASDRETRQDVDLKKLIDTTIELIQFKIEPGSVVFENIIPAELPPVKGNFAQLQEVIFNIIDNAYASMMDKREANEVPDYKPHMTFNAQEHGGEIRLTITDNGMGVKEENIPKLFTPLFSTKRASKKGHGLGLYVMKQIIEKNHNGRIQLTSHYPHGLTIDIDLGV